MTRNVQGEGRRQNPGAKLRRIQVNELVAAQRRFSSKQLAELYKQWAADKKSVLTYVQHLKKAREVLDAVVLGN